MSWFQRPHCQDLQSAGMTKIIHVANSTDRTIKVVAAPRRNYAIGDLLGKTAALSLGSVLRLRTLEAVYGLSKANRLIPGPDEITRAMIALATSPGAIEVEPGKAINVSERITELKDVFTASFYADLFGEKTMTLFISDENAHRTVLLDSAADHSWIVEDRGVRRSVGGTLFQPSGDLHRWAYGRIGIGFDTSAPPSVVWYRDQLHCYFRDGGGDGNGILHVIFENGTWKKAREYWTKIDTNGGPTFVPYRDFGVLIYQPLDSDQLRCGFSGDGIRFQDVNTEVKIPAHSRPSAAVLGDTLCIVGRRPPIRDGFASSIWASVFDGRTFHPIGLRPPSSTVAPCIATFQGRFHLFSGDLVTKHVQHRSSADGRSWKQEPDLNISTSAGPTAIEYDGRLWLFYRDPDGNGVFCTSSSDGISFQSEQESYFGFDTRAEFSATIAGEKIHLMGQDPSGRQMMWAVPMFRR
jgi:hypothetical protein